MRVSIPLPRRCERRTLPIELIPQHIWELHGRAILAVAAVDVELSGQLVDNWLTTDCQLDEHCEIMSLYFERTVKIGVSQDTRYKIHVGN